MTSEQTAIVLLLLGLVLIGVVTIALVLASAPSQTTPETPLKLEPPLPKDVDGSGVFEELDRLGQAGQIKAEEEAKLRPWLRPIGIFGRLLTYAALFWLLYTWAPKDISHTPLATLTLYDIGGTIIFAVIGIMLVRALFDPSDDDQIKNAWGWFGVVVLGVVAIGALFLLYAVR